MIIYVAQKYLNEAGSISVPRRVVVNTSSAERSVSKSASDNNSQNGYNVCVGKECLSYFVFCMYICIYLVFCFFDCYVIGLGH